jgi:cytochrome bd ubiquinol oxidase subunit I
MTDLLAARSQMALSLAFHIIFASIGIAMPFFMAVSHFLWLRGGDPVYLRLTKAWSKGVAIFFATGAVSGTVLSFELGLLWPEFMKHAGPIIGMPFSWEGTAFFIEAIALGLFLYGWGRLHRWVHWATGVVVGVSGVLSGLFVVCVNGWMNAPTGFDWVNGTAVNIDPVAAMFNDAALLQGVHMTVAAFQATGVAVAGLHAALLLRTPQSQFHRAALGIALAFGASASLLQPVVGDLIAKDVARRQPVKLAAMESLFVTAQPAPLIIGGIPDEESETVSYGLHIPYGLSFLAKGDPFASVAGLEHVPRDERPPVLVVHLAFQIMVAIGSLLALVGMLSLYCLIRRRTVLDHRRFLMTIAACTPLGFIAIEAGWIVTEVGRQPWIIYRVMRTADALTPVPGLVYPFLLFTSVYLVLSAVVTWLMMRQIAAVQRMEGAST